MTEQQYIEYLQKQHNFTRSEAQEIAILEKVKEAREMEYELRKHDEDYRVRIDSHQRCICKHK